MKRINIITSPSTAARTEETLKCLNEAVANGKEAYLIVPAQYTLTAERLCIEKLGERVTAKINITTLTRLAKKIFSENGTPFSFIGKAGKTALLSKAYSELDERLQRYSGYYHINFISELASQISELKSFKITPSDFEAAASLNEKMADISLIYSAYDAMLGQSLADSDDILPAAAEQISEGNMFADACIFAEFFKYISASELAVFETMCAAGAELTLSLSLDEKREIFSMSERVISSLKRFANRTGKELCFKQAVTSVKKPKALEFIEKNLFSDNGAVCKSSDGITLYCAADKNDELDFIACEISRLVREEGFRYSDFAIVTRNPQTYEAAAQAVFSSYDIPVFNHRKGAVTQKLAAKFLSALLSVLLDGYKPDNITELLRCGVLDISEKQLAAFEKYINVWNVRYGYFRKPFIKNINGFHAIDDISEDDAQALADAEAVRAVTVSLVEDFREKTKNATVEDISCNITELFESVKMEERLSDAGTEYLKYKQPALYEENLQVYELIISTLDDIVTVCGDDKITLSKYRDLLELTLSSVDIGIIPTSVDEVLSGDVLTAPLHNCRCVFVYGLYEGAFPAAVSSAGLIAYTEREKLEENGIRLGLSAEDEILYEKYLAYFAMSAATERLYLCRPAVSGEEKRPSEAYEAVKAMFSSISESCANNSELSGSADSRIQRLRPSFGLYTRQNAKNMKPAFEGTAMQRFTDEKEAETHALSSQLARRIFGTTMNLSPSRSDTYSRCPYSYFLQYGLYIRDDVAAGFNALNTGTFIHDILEHIIGAPNWLELTADEIKNEINKCISSFFKKIFGDEKPPAAYLAYAKNLFEKVQKLLAVFRDEFIASKFKPVAFELEISDGSEIKPVSLEIEGGKIRLGGKIDRVDAYFDGQKTYLRITDYKSHSKQLCFWDISRGINVQMLFYLYALRENGTVRFTNPEPAGVMYINVKPKIKKRARGELSKQENLSTSGLFLSDISVLHAMEPELGGKYIPVTEKNINGDLTLSKAEFDMVFSHIKKIFTDMGSALLAGNIPKEPLNSKSAQIKCPYCPIRTTCTKKDLPGMETKLSKDDFLKFVRGEETHNGLDIATTESN